MNGNQHFMIGVSVTASMMMVGLATRNDALVMTSLIAPIGAMFPDIDHDMTKIGRVRKNVMSVLGKIINIFLVGLFACGLYLSIVNSDIFNGILCCLASIALFICFKSNLIKTHLTVYTKHRGIMHTMLMPCMLFYLGRIVNNTYITYACYSLSLGYVSHLYADLYNVRGLPMLFPFTVKPIRLPFIHIPTKSKMCYVASIFIMAQIVYIGYLLSGGLK